MCRTRSFRTRCFLKVAKAYFLRCYRLLAQNTSRGQHKDYVRGLAEHIHLSLSYFLCFWQVLIYVNSKKKNTRGSFGGDDEEKGSL